MTDRVPRCAVCGRRQPAGQHWPLFADRANDERWPICSAGCLATWTERKPKDADLRERRPADRCQHADPGWLEDGLYRTEGLESGAVVGLGGGSASGTRSAVRRDDVRATGGPVTAYLGNDKARAPLVVVVGDTGRAGDAATVAATSVPGCARVVAVPDLIVLRLRYDTNGRGRA